MGAYTTNASYGWWSLYLDPSGTQIYFGGQTNNGAGANYLSASMNWISNEWHFVALTYSPSNSALYLDGQLTTNGTGVLYWPNAAVQATNGFSIGSDSSGLNLAQGQFERLVTFNYPLSAGYISNFYQLAIQKFPILPGGDSIMNGGLDSFGHSSFGAGWPGLEGCQNPLALLTPIYQGTNVIVPFTGYNPASQYDLFYSINLITWGYYGRSAVGQSSFTFTNQPLPKGFFLLGTMQNTDGDSYTDAYELLISHTPPFTNWPSLKVFITLPSNLSILP